MEIIPLVILQIKKTIKMKKVLIVGYFVLMFTLTYVVGLAISTYKSEKVEYKSRIVEKRVTETELRNLGIVVKPIDANVKRVITLIEIRTKKTLGWDVRRDTVSVNYE